MSNLQSLLKKLSAAPSSAISYVYYNKDTGKIHKISSKNIPEEGYAVFEIENQEVKPILTGERRTDEFVIFYDVSLKQIRLKEVAYEDSHTTASTMCYQLPVIKNTHSGHFVLDQVYEGMTVYVWDITKSYNKDDCVWYDNCVYKLVNDTLANTDLDLDLHTTVVEDVFLTSIPTQSHSAEKLTMILEYEGIHVDVWYKELSHLAGQHVWLNGTVYKLLEDQDANTEFTLDNAETVVSNVKLYADENQSLKTIDNVSLGELILNNNSIYSVQITAQEFDKDNRSVFFYNTAHTLLYYDVDETIEVDLNSLDESLRFRDTQIILTNISDLKNGQTILCGKQLYQVQIDKSYDIIVQQDTVSRSWNLKINPYTKQFLINSGYRSSEKIHFSVTAKYDPNILYRSLEFTVADLLDDRTSTIPFRYDVEQDATDVSIYTARYFDSYAHEVI